MKACTQPFVVTGRVKQGCVLAPVTLFSMVFSALRTDAIRSGDIEVDFTITPTANSLRSLQGEWTTNVSTLHYHFRLCGMRSDVSM